MSNRHRVIRNTAIALLASVAFAACSDSDGSSLTGVRSTAAKLELPATLDGQINTLIQNVIPPANRSNIQSWWDGIKRLVAKKDARAAQSLVDLSYTIQKMTPKLLPPAGLTQAEAAAQLVQLMGLYVHGGPETPPPPVLTEESDATLAIVSPTSTVETTVETPSEQAAVVFPPGAVTVPTIVVVTRNEESFEAECSGPLPTTRCQYPQFYKFDVFPDVKLNSPAFVAVCHVNHGDHRLPRADHQRFRVAHQRPSDPAAYHPEGTIEGDIEILPLVTREAVTDCEQTDYDHAVVPPDAGLLERLAIHTRFKAGRAARAVGRVLTPKSLYAIDRGGGGSVLMFSDFAVIDPQSIPDIFPTPRTEAGFSLSASSVSRGESVTLRNVALFNDGTGPANSVSASIVLASNPGLSEDVVVLGAYPTTPVLYPDLQSPFADVPVTIPASVSAGPHYIGVRADPDNAVAELDETNNTLSLAITVTDPITVLCQDGVPGHHGTLESAVAATSPGGTIQVCGGTYAVESVLIDKPLTIIGDSEALPHFLTQTSLQGLLLQHPTGTVTVRHIQFRNHYPNAIVDGQQVFSYSIRATGTFANVTVEDSRFDLLTGGHASGIQASNGGIPSNSVLTVRRSTFTGGRAAIAVGGTNPASAVHVFESSFSGQRQNNAAASNFAIQVTGSQTVTLMENTITDCGQRCVTVNNGHFVAIENQISQCGPFTCIQTSNTTGTIANNDLSNRVLGEYDPYFHHVLLLTNDANQTVEMNRIDGCGRGQCILAILRAQGTIRYNTVRAYYGEGTRIGIVLSDGSLGNGTATTNGATLTVEDNTIEAVSGPAGLNPDDPNSYAYNVSGIHVEGYSHAVVNRNRIDNANVGFFTRTGGTTDGTRNTVTRARIGFAILDAASRAGMNWNDISGYQRAFDQSANTGNNLTCNWWGGPAGPTNFSTSQGAGMYTPWATTPVAATGTGPCTGSSDPLYSYQEMGRAPGTLWANARAINSGGMVVGQGGSGFPSWQGWRWSSGMASVLNLPNPCGDWYSANDVNSAGIIAMNSAYCAMLWDPAVGNTIGVPTPAGTNRSGAYSVNDNGLVLACADNGSFAYNYIYNRASGQLTPINGYANFCYGDINNVNQAVISSDPGAGGATAVFNYASNTTTPLPGMPGRVVNGMAINDAGVVVGRACNDGGTNCRAWRWVPGMTSLQDLGTLGGATAAALGINNAGQVVGWAQNASGQQRAFIWNPSTGVMSQLMTPADVTESVANAINGSGVIVGSVGTVQTNSRPARWTPILP